MSTDQATAAQPARPEENIQRVGPDQMIVTSSRHRVLVASSVGAGVVLTLYDRQHSVGGLLYSTQPLSLENKGKALANPAAFVDTGVPALLAEVYRQGAEKRILVAKLAGCAHEVRNEPTAETARRNHSLARKLLWKNNILISGQDVGGSVLRMVMLNLATGHTVVRASGRIIEL